MKSNDNNHLHIVDQNTLGTGALAFCRKAAAQIQKAKAAILSEFRQELEQHQHLLQLAVNEAEALAWQTDFPHLFFPTLATEKVQEVSHWQARQQFLHGIRERLPLAA